MHDEVMGRTQTGFTEAYAQSLSVDCDLDLATWLLFTIYRLIKMVIYANLFSNPTIQDKFMGRTCFWNTKTHTYTDRVNYICPSAISWLGHNKRLFSKMNDCLQHKKHTFPNKFAIQISCLFFFFMQYVCLHMYKSVSTN